MFRTTTLMECLNTDKETAEKIRGLMVGDIDPLDFEAGQDRERECFHPPGDADLALHVIDGLLETCGVEGFIRPRGRGVSYCNTGDTYCCTVGYLDPTFSSQGQWLLGDLETMAGR